MENMEVQVINKCILLLNCNYQPTLNRMGILKQQSQQMMLPDFTVGFSEAPAITAQKISIKESELRQTASEVAPMSPSS